MAITKQRPKLPGSPFVGRIASGLPPLFVSLPITTSGLNTDTSIAGQSAYRANLVAAPPRDSVRVIDRVKIVSSFGQTSTTGTAGGVVGLRISKQTAAGNNYQATDLPFLVIGPGENNGAAVEYDIRNFGLVLEGPHGVNGTGLFPAGDSLGFWSYLAADQSVNAIVYGRTLSRQEAISCGDLRFGNPSSGILANTNWKSWVNNTIHTNVVQVSAVPGYCHVIRTLVMMGKHDGAGPTVNGNFRLQTDTGTATDPVNPIMRLFTAADRTTVSRVITTNANIVLPENTPIISQTIRNEVGTEALFFGYETIPVSRARSVDGSTEVVKSPGIADAKVGCWI